jgi:hypothetical protein
MELLKQLLTYAILVLIVGAGLVYIPKLTSRVQVPPDYVEIAVPDVEHYPSYSFQPLDSVSALNRGDAVCYRIPNSDGGAYGNGFGWVAGMPGDEVRIAAGKVTVNGTPSSASGAVNGSPDMGPLVVPEGHVFVVSTMHMTDSVMRGPLPLSVLRGRLESFP